MMLLPTDMVFFVPRKASISLQYRIWCSWKKIASHHTLFFSFLSFGSWKLKKQSIFVPNKSGRLFFSWTRMRAPLYYEENKGIENPEHHKETTHTGTRSSLGRLEMKPNNNKEEIVNVLSIWVVHFVGLWSITEENSKIVSVSERVKMAPTMTCALSR